jgi:threonine dehydratase
MTSSQTTPTQTTLIQTVTIHDIRRADAAIRPAVLETPLLTSDRLNATLPFDLYLKAESLQRTGSFKFRGACNAVFGLEDPEQAVIAFSSGNHAQAVALAAKLASRKATIIMPKDAPTAKIEGTKSYGVEVVLYDRYTESREEIGAHYAKQTGANLIKPYDDVRVIAGQGTAGCEIVRQSEALSLTPDTFISCCGGGGLIAGTAIALSDSFPDITLY